jgi:hypothetical protein
MKANLYTLIFILLGLCSVEAQRYLIPGQFGVNREAGVPYGENISILTGTPMPLELTMDVYTPAGDTATNRPLILVAHTGSFLPPLFNGQVTGSVLDSTVTYTAGVLASMGYVVAAYTYRQGWLPTATDPDTRRGTLLQAAYRGIQDTRSCVRYFRKNAAEDGNEYGIDPNKIGVVGIGTGGYLALGAGSLDEWDEVTLDKFIDTRTALPYIDSTIYGNLYGTTDAALCLANTPGYSSDIQFSFNLGGALGDLSWLDGRDNEPAYAGVHCVNDIFAPYDFGPVIVPTTNEFVVNVSGTRDCIEEANRLGSNDALMDIPEMADLLRPLIEQQKQTDVTLLTGQTIKVGTDNFYGFNLPVPQGSPWDWWSLDVLRVVVDLTNQAAMTNFNADSLHADGLATNPGMSAEQAKTYFDTIFALMIPRACAAMDLGCFTINTTDLDPSQVGLEVGPNPAVAEVFLNTDAEYPIESVYLYDLNGRLVMADVDLKTNSYTIQRRGLAQGVYLADIRFKDGRISRKIQFQ